MPISMDNAFPPVIEHGWTEVGQGTTPRLNENTQVHQLKAQGQDVTQIAVDLSLTSAAVGQDLLVNIPKYPLQGASVLVSGAVFSVRA